MNQPKTTELCLHCGARLRANSSSQMCRRCRLYGHKEFGECGKCDKSTAKFKTANSAG